MKNVTLQIAGLASFFLLALVLFFPSNIQAQNDVRTLLENLEEEELQNIDALAMYPEDTRLAILQATLHPEALIKIQRIQSKIKERFTNLMNQYPQATQREIWDLTRYPDLIHRMLTDVDRNRYSIDDVLSDYPKAIHKRAKSSLKNHNDLLRKVDALNHTSEAAFNNIVSNYDEGTQNAFRTLVDLPEVMTVLNENIEVTILVGDAYKNYPQWILRKGDSLNLELARENVKELEDWKKRVEDNPEVAEDLQASAEDFAKENGYDDLYYDSEDYDYPDDDLYYNADDRESIGVKKHYYNNYPFWYGYPTWYAYPRWRPYPYWYDWGFHYRPGRSIVIAHMPSVYFVDWYFYQPNHHYYYSHLSANFVDHYYGHRHSVGSITSSVHTWRVRNRAVISEDMIVNAPRRINEYKEFGKMETARIKYNKNNPRTPLSQNKFVEKNKKTYPKLRKEVARNETFTSKGKPEIISKRKTLKHKTKFPKQREKVIPKREKIRILKKKETPPRVIKKKNANKTKVETKKKTTREAKNYHQKTWEKSKARKIQPRKRVKTKMPKRRTTKSIKSRNKTTPIKKKTKNN
jgi:hypothetical protein